MGHRTKRVVWGAAVVMVIAGLAAGCSCSDASTLSVERACAPTTYLYFGEVLTVPGAYTIEVTPHPDGRVFECSFSVPRVPDDEVCSNGAGVLAEHGTVDAGPRDDISLPSQFEAASVVIARDGVEVCRGEAELLRVEELEWTCGSPACRRPILRTP